MNADPILVDSGANNTALETNIFHEESDSISYNYCIRVLGSNTSLEHNQITIKNLSSPTLAGGVLVAGPNCRFKNNEFTIWRGDIPEIVVA